MSKKQHKEPLFDPDDIPNGLDHNEGHDGEASFTPRVYSARRLPTTPSEWMALRPGTHARIVHSGGKEKPASRRVIEANEEQAEPHITYEQWCEEQEHDVASDQPRHRRGYIPHVNRKKSERRDHAVGVRTDVTALVDAIIKNPDTIMEEQQFSPGSWNILCAGDYMPKSRTSITVAKEGDAYFARPTASLRMFAEAALKGGDLMQDYGHLLDGLPKAEPRKRS